MSSKLGDKVVDLDAGKLLSSDVRKVCGKDSTIILPKPPSGPALLDACLHELEKESYLSGLEMDYLSIYRRILNTTLWDLNDETSSWN